MKAYQFSAALLVGATLASADGLAQTSIGGQPAIPNEIIYLPQLPAAGALAGPAQASGMTITAIDQKPNEEVVVYRLANGQSSTVSYRPLPPADAAGVTIGTTSPPSTVVYEAANPYAYDYYPWGWWGPWANLGFGSGYGHGYGGYRGGGFGGGGYRGGGFSGGEHGGGGHR